MESSHDNPADEYARRLNALLAVEARAAGQSKIFGIAKLLAITFTVIAGLVLAKYDPGYIATLFAPLVLIVLLFVLHERILRTLRRCVRLKAFYKRGLARLDGSWPGTGQQGERFLEPNHPYARDLDLFGKGSMFELLSTARTRAGEETLAAWLLAPASIEEISARQAAIRELQPLLDFREQLAMAGEDIQIGVRPDSLLAWSEKTTRLNPKMARIAAPVLTALWVVSLVTWGIFGWFAAAILISLLNLTVTYRYRSQVEKAAAEIEEAMHDLDLLAAIFRQIETQSFTSRKLVDLQAILISQKESASEAISRLNRRVTWLESRENLFVKFADLFIFWTAQWTAAIEAWRAEYGTAMRGWLGVVGEMEALSSLAGYAYEHPEDTLPQFVEHGPYLDIEAFSHPLIPRSRAVANDLKLDEKLQMLVISGPNMAGKSTFIRSVGVNAVLAQAGAPVRARRMALSRLTVTASICILDSLQGGLSRFYAEIMRLKLIDEQSRGAGSRSCFFWMSYCRERILMTAGWGRNRS